MTLPPDALARPPAGPPADQLRAWGFAHPDVSFVMSVLPRCGPRGLAEACGLYVETSRIPWVSVKGELRVSLLRVFSVLQHDAVLVAQVQVTERTDERGRLQRRVKGYVHDPRTFVTREAVSLDDWWLRVLERHYELGGDALDLAAHAPASA